MIHQSGKKLIALVHSVTTGERMSEIRYRCMRCGSDSTLRGVIYDMRYGGHERLTFISTDSPHSVQLSAVFCRVCGHTELMGDTEDVAEGIRIKCPKCDATYSYGRRKISKNMTVRCQNCGKVLKLSSAEMMRLDESM